MPLTTNALERLILTRLNFAPALLLDYFSTLGFRAALVGVRLGVFDALEKGLSAIRANYGPCRSAGATSALWR